MNNGSGTHGPHKDDALKRDVRSELRAGRSTRTEEWHEPEPPGDDQPDATWAPSGRPSPDGGPDADQLELRADLARQLGPESFPADRRRLLATLARRNAPPPLPDLVAELPDGRTFGSLGDVARALGLPMESR